MATHTYALEPGGLPRLGVETEAGRISLTVDGQPLGTIDSPGALTEEPRFNLPDGSILRVAPSAERDPPLRITRNGQPLPDHARDPDRAVADASRALFAIAAIVLALSGIALFTGAKYLSGPLNLGVLSAAGALALGLCGFLVGRKSKAALYAAMGLLVAFALMAAARAVASEGNAPLWPLPLWLLGLVPLSKAMGALR